MSGFTKRYLVVVALLFLTANAVFFFQKSEGSTVKDINIFEIPLQIGEWKGREIPIEKRILDILETQSVLMREYSNGKGESVYLTIVYYTGNRVELHLPERCLVGHGSEIAEREKLIIGNKTDRTNITANKLILKNNKNEVDKVVVYYFESGAFCTPNYQDLRWQMILNKLRRIPNNGALLEFSALVKKNPDETVNMLSGFITQMMPLLKEYLI